MREPLLCDNVSITKRKDYKVIVCSDVNKDLTLKAKDKDHTLKAKDQDKDCSLVLKESLRTRTNITDCLKPKITLFIDNRQTIKIYTFTVRIYIDNFQL